MNLRLKELYTLYSVQELAEHCLHEESENKILNNRINKAIELISKEFLCYDNESDEYTQGKKAINILNGGDEE